MKILDTRIMVLFLIVVFLIVNFIFLLQYIFSKQEENLKIQENSDNLDFISKEVKYLKKIVDFNNTAFESNGIVHFYNSAYNKNTFIKNLTQNFIQTNFTYNISNRVHLNYFYDYKSEMFVDSNLKICRRNYFNFEQFICQGKIIKLEHNHIKNSNYNNNKEDSYKLEYEYMDYNCDNRIKCCKKEYECLYKCFEDLMISNKDYMRNQTIFKKCRKICEIKLYTKNYELPFCYLYDKFYQQDTNIAVILSDINQSCDETCIKKFSKPKTCYNHILKLTNNCEYLTLIYNCNECIKKEIYGSAIKIIDSSENKNSHDKDDISTMKNTICYISNDNNINCKYKNEKDFISRVCACIE